MSTNKTTIRILILGTILMLGYVILLSSMWMVQIEKGEEHREQISRQSIRRIRIPSVRGRIYTSDGKAIAENTPQYDVVFHLGEMRRPGRRSNTVDYILKQIDRIGAEIGRQSHFSEKDILYHMNRPGLPMTIFENLSTGEMSQLVEMRHQVSGMDISTRSQRSYPNGRAFCHLLGYTGLADPKKADDKEDFSYYVPDLIGKEGLERKLDDIKGSPVVLRGLCGEPGLSLVRVDHRGYIFETLNHEDAISGNDVILTIDRRAQMIAYRLLQDRVGAMIVMDADNGAILAMVSSPGYDPNEFSGGISQRRWQELLQDKDTPLFHRAAMGAFTPGSIVKPLVALALLENHADISPVVCDGYTMIGKTRIRCASWRRGGHGEVNLEEALAVSCNDFFIEKGVQLGLEKIDDIFHRAGLGRKTGFMLSESAGLIPAREDKLRLYRSRWNEYDTALLSIGQGIILLTPLQVVTYTAALANGGTLWRPQLIREVTEPDGHPLYVIPPQQNGSLQVTPENLARVREGMWKVVHESHGSGRRAKNDKIELYGKSGTGEVGAVGHRYNNTWFIAFGSAGGKTYAAVIFVSHGASGGGTCALLMKRFFEEWLPDQEETGAPAGE
ncbi:MAG: penicillin-binding protein 2 [Victivallales bacterium]|nr:penicillin-binding protein 2 [Victivallales bacterium]